MARSRSDRRSAKLADLKPANLPLGQKSSRTGSFRQTPIWVPGDPEAVRPVVPGETYPLFVAGILIAFVALFVCFHHGYLLLYGDAVAHLAIARRILDAKWPGLAQLGGVWLPLPHILMLPFIMNMRMWQTGLAGAPMSMLSYAASVAGIWRLSRRLMKLRWALVATTFYALNANLLFLSTTAMTEALFLALLIWSVVATCESIAALRANDLPTARARMMLAGLLILGQVFTRYDGWIIGAIIWLCFAIVIFTSSEDVRRRMRPHFIVFTVFVASGPLLWFWYNAHFEHDWLDFLRGPYSAAQIERRTAPPGQHYRGWHNLGWAALFYTRTAQIDAAAWETGSCSPRSTASTSPSNAAPPPPSTLVPNPSPSFSGFRSRFTSTPSHTGPSPSSSRNSGPTLSITPATAWNSFPRSPSTPRSPPNASRPSSNPELPPSRASLPASGSQPP
jgi:hypothetical protein